MISIRTYIFKRPLANGNYSWRVRWKDPKTRDWRSISGGRSKDEAKIVEAQVRQRLLQGIDPLSVDKLSDEWTVAKIIAIFYDHSRYLSGTERWKKDVRKKITNDILPELGNVLFKDLNPDRTYKFYLYLKRRHLAHATIEKYHHLLAVIGDIYAEQSIDLVNPIRRIRDFSKRFPKQAPSRDINFLTPEELEKLFKETKRSQRALLSEFTRFMAYTGLRRTEALELKWTDIDERAKLLHVRKSKSGRSRTIPLEEEALSAVIGLKGNGPFIFSKFDGSRYYPDSFLRPLQRAAKRAGIEKRIDIHTLRHSYGSNKIRMGWGIKKVSVLLGHADISTTAKIYTHLLDGDLKIRDDARLGFDKNQDSQHIEREAGSAENMAHMIANAITTHLAGSQEGQKALMGLLESLSKTSPMVQAQDPASSVEIYRDSLVSKKNGVCAPLMLRESKKAPQSVFSTKPTETHFPALFQNLVSEGKMEPMIRIERTTYALRKRCSTTELHRLFTQRETVSILNSIERKSLFTKFLNFELLANPLERQGFYPITQSQ